MKITHTVLADVLIIEPDVFQDARGFFFESFNQQEFNRATGLSVNFVQDNHSQSARGVLRGLHYQIKQAQGKLVRVSRGAVFDVVVDIRKSSTTFGQWLGLELTEHNCKQLWIPPGFAHGSLALADNTDFLYKVTDYHAPLHERCIRWDDPELSICWPSLAKVLLSDKDFQGLNLLQADLFG